jgi:hypothetical protein
MRRFRHHCTLPVVVALALASAGACAQTVTMNGRLGTQQALLVIDGQPHAVAVGATVKGVRVHAVNATQAERAARCCSAQGRSR